MLFCLSIFDLLIVSFLAPLGAVIHLFLLYKLIAASIGYKIRKFAKEKVLG